MHDMRIEVYGVVLQVREYAHDGEVIIFLHFGGGNLMMWQGVIPYFEGRYRLLLIDLRGHGKSDSPRSGYHIDQMSADVLDVMAQLGVERAHLVGSSLGAEAALSLAANHPDKALSLVCEGAYHSEAGPYSASDQSDEEFEAHVAERMAQMRAEPEAAYDSVAALMAETQRAYEGYGWWNERVEALERYNICQNGAGSYVQQWRKWVRLEYMQHYFGYRFDDYYRRVECPVLMLPGESVMADEGTRRAMEALSLLPARCQIVAPPGWVHPYGWLLYPEVGSRAVLDFLEGINRA